ncbi:fimbria/pilus outer membrane usher protein [Escherichia coli]|uniref:fimbria/pilus outer membrane usher protein n=1 Tax=Escherichia coli TaxID=562 RepID=UPI00207C04E9|nr:fimbria/pilus outer membrane usher protein [Escherichia coli]
MMNEYICNASLCSTSLCTQKNKLSYTTLFIIIISSFFYVGDVAARSYSFDESLLNGGGKGVDLRLLENGGQLPGIYPVDIILNGAHVESRDMFFHTGRDIHGKDYLRACLTKEMLIRYGVKVEEYPGLFRINSEKERGRDICADLSVIPQATEYYRFLSQQLIIGIPQVAIRPSLTGIAPEVMWDDGIDAFVVNWQAEASRFDYRGYGRNSSDNFWSSFEPGINIGAWRLRNLTTWNKSSGQSGKWDSSYIRAERGLNSIRSRLTLGEGYSPADIFDSVPFRGGMLGTDEYMIPYNQREFAPVVRGIARTQARIEVRQNGYLIHSQIVAPGAFALNDLPVTGSSDDLQVAILESDGTIQSFKIPFTLPAIALREGYLKYNVTVGQYRPSDSGGEKAYLAQSTVMYGLPWGVTAFAGVQGAEHYRAGALGLGLSLGNFGAMSLDTIYSRGQQKGYEYETGQTWRIRYDKSFGLTGTSFAAASYQYTGENYHTLADVLNTYNNVTSLIDRNFDNKTRRITMNINQPLGRWGHVGLNGGRDVYRSKPNQDYIGASYSTSWKNISLSLNWSRNLNLGNCNGRRFCTEDNFNMWISVPLQRWWGGYDNDIYATAQMQRSTRQNSSYEVGLSGRAFERKLNWDVSEQIVPGSKYDADTGRLKLRWSGTYGELAGMYSYNTNTRQMNLGMSGSMVMHSEGLTFGQRTGDTIGLIVAPDVAGASVSGWPGVSTGSRGYGVVGYVSPYQENVLTLDPTTFPENVEVPQTDSRVVPTKGAVVRAEFKTRVGKRAVLNLIRKDGTRLPFGTVITLEGKVSGSVGVVDDKGAVYLSGLSETGKLKAQWGRNSQCYADYILPKEKGPAGVFLTNAVCI